MSNDSRNTYEAMFVMDSSGTDFQAASEPIRKVLDRSQAEIIALKPWDERRLAYEVKGRRRGLYALAYFTADPGKVVEIEHDCQLSDEILRVLIIHKEKLTDDEINADTPMRPSKPAETSAEGATEPAKPAEKAEPAKPAPAAEAEGEGAPDSEQGEDRQAAADSDEEADDKGADSDEPEKDD
jgi:small subunit ribosomal protein S6